MRNAEPPELRPRLRPRRALSAAVATIVVAALAYVVARDRQDFVDTWTRIGVSGALVAIALGVANGVFTWLQWRTVLGGLGVNLDPGHS